MLRFGQILAVLAAIALLNACSPKTLAVNLIADQLSSSGGSFSSDPDPDLVREALPFGLKTYEGLLQSAPEHRGLLLATAKGFASYAYILKDAADRTEDRARARELRQRAKKLFLRGRDYALRGLALTHPELADKLKKGKAASLKDTTKEDADFLYWAGAAWAGAVSSDKQDYELVAELPMAARLVERVNKLDDSYGEGAAHQFLVSYEGGRPGGDRKAAKAHYRRALKLSKGGSAGLYLALAETIAVEEQDLKSFRSLIDDALAVDLDKFPDRRAENALAQRRARWLKARIPDLFLDASEEDTASSAEGSKT